MTTHYAQDDNQLQSLAESAQDGDTIEVMRGVVCSGLDWYQRRMKKIRIRGYRNARWLIKPDGLDFGIRLCSGVHVQDFDLDGTVLAVGPSRPGTGVKFTYSGDSYAHEARIENFRIWGCPHQGFLTGDVTGISAESGLIRDCGDGSNQDHCVYLGKNTRQWRLKNVSTLRPSGYGVQDYHGEEADPFLANGLLDGGWHVGSKIRSGILIAGTGTRVRNVISACHPQYGLSVYHTARDVVIEKGCDLSGVMGRVHIADGATFAPGSDYP